MHELESLKSIFKDRLFKIPDYQRGYAWKERQLKDFWEDLINLPNERLHYTGLLSLKRVTSNIYKKDGWEQERWLIEDRAFKAFHIVDGQQRLTTFVIFINEIINLVRNLPENLNKKDTDIYLGTFNLESIQEEYIVINKPPHYISKAYKFGYEKDNPSFEFLKYRILGEQNPGKIEETFYTLNLENARNYFKENLKKFYEVNGILEIESLFRKITQNLMFNLHEIEDDFDVFVAFETMNNRGKTLSNLELLKNRLIYLTTLYSESDISNDERSVLRVEINNSWKEVYAHLGKNKQKPLSDDDFLLAHWIMYFQYTRQKGDDYIKFLLEEKFTPQNIFVKKGLKVHTFKEITEIRDQSNDEESIEIDVQTVKVKTSKLLPTEIFNYVTSLKSSAVHWYNSFYPVNNNDLSKEEQLWLDRLNRIGISYFRPLVVSSFLRTDIDEQDRIRLFKEIERFIFLSFRVGRAFSTFRNSEYYKLTKQLQNGEVQIDEICNSLRSRVENWLNAESNLSIQYFSTYLARHFKNGDGFYSWNGLEYFLYEYEYDLVRKNGNKKIDWDLFVKSVKDKVSIEHIYPQTPSNDYWLSRFTVFSEEERKFLTGSLGNLLPLSSSKNASLQNDSFDDKKNPCGKSHKGYADGSHCEIEVSMYNEWNAEAILHRGIKLLEFMENRWDIKFASKDDMKKLLFLDFLE